MTEATPRVSPVRSERPALELAAAARQPVEAVLQELGSTQTGLISDEANGRLRAVGPNVLAAHRVTALGVLVRQLRNPLLILLLAAAGVSAATGDPTDGAIIAAIVVLGVGLGFINEYRSEMAVAALHANIRHQALVWRDGRQQRLDVRELVPGDVVALGVGDVVPADLRLLEANQLECDEAVLTGEAMPAIKSAAGDPAGDSAVDLPSCAFMGTVVHQGAGRGVVEATGSLTAFGKIAVGLAERQAETAFQTGLRDLFEAAGAGRRGADRLHFSLSTSPSTVRCWRRCCFPWRSRSASPRSCSRRSSASACRAGRGSWSAAECW
jgi:P-type Mg2+ transporter